MRIDEIAVDGFGLIRDRRLAPAPGLTLIRGENEAGKSTLLAFIRSILFGFETNRHPALSGGRRGGWLTVTSADGRRIRIERYGTTGGGGQLRVLDEDREDLGAEFLPTILRGVERTVYNNVFAFGLAELAEFSNLNGAAIAARIYGAGMGTGSTSVVDIENNLETMRADLFVKKGRIPRINVLLAEIELLEGKIATLDPPLIFREAGGRRAALEGELAGLSGEAALIAVECRRLERLRDGWPSWLVLGAARAQAAELGQADAIPVPADLLERLAAAERDLGAATERTAELATDRERAITARDTAAVDEALLAARPAAEALLAVLPEARDERIRLAELEHDRTERAAALGEALRRLGPDWDEARLLTVDDSLAAQGAIARPFRVSFETTERDLATARAEAATADLSLADGRAELAAVEPATRNVAVADAPGGVAAPRSATGAAPLATWLIVGLVLGVAAGIGALLFGLGIAQALVLGLLVGTVSAVLETIWGPSRRQLATGSTADPLATRREERRGRVRLLEERARTAADRLAAAGSALDLVQASWQAWLADHGLPPELDREMAARLLEGAIGARASLATLRATEGRRDDMAARLATHEAAARSFLAGLSRPADDPLVGLELVRRDLEVTVAAAVDRGRAVADLDRIDAALAAVSLVHEVAAQEQAAVLTAGHVSDGVALRAALTEGGRRAEVQREIRAAHDTLVALSGPGEAIATFEADLAGFGDLARIEAQLEAELERGRALDTRRAAALEELGAERETISRIERSVEAADLRQQRADGIAGLEVLAESWSVTTIALALLRRTRARYERDHRPEVLKVAEELLASWTGGRYIRILAPLGKPVQELERGDGVIVPLGALSTGTAQQLYLALRFGLVEHFARQAESLPVVMDDILVNFDPVRAKRAARSIEDLATRHQVLYFTCHPATPIAAARTIELPALLGG